MRHAPLGATVALSSTICALASTAPDLASKSVAVTNHGHHTPLSRIDSSSNGSTNASAGSAYNTTMGDTHCAQCSTRISTVLRGAATVSAFCARSATHMPVEAHADERVAHMAGHGGKAHGRRARASITGRMSA